MFQVCFHTAFFEKYYLLFEKPFVDIAVKDVDNRLFAKEFSLEIIGNRIPDDVTYFEALSDQEDIVNHEPKYDTEEEF